jgi:tyrosinase
MIQNIAAIYPENVKAQYVAAAKRFRIPYWDWGIVPKNGQSILPKSVQSPTTKVKGPGGLQEISNPLFSYIFDPLNSSELPDAPVSVLRWNCPSF